MKMAFFGKGPRGFSCLEAVIAAGHEVALVVTATSETELLAIAVKADISVASPDNVNSSEFISLFAGYKIDLGILCGFTQIMRPAIIDVPRYGFINMHGGRLPHYRGASPMNWQIIRGEKSGGLAILYVDSGIDTGDILREAVYEIGPDETITEVVNKTIPLFQNMLLDVIGKFAESWRKNGPRIQGQPQDKAAGAYFCKRHPRDGVIEWNSQTDLEVHNLVRSLAPPYPGAFSFINDKKIIICETRLLAENFHGTPGRIALYRSSEAIVLAANRGIVIMKVMNDCGEIVKPRDVLGPAGGDFRA